MHIKIRLTSARAEIELSANIQPTLSLLTQTINGFDMTLTVPSIPDFLCHMPKLGRIGN